MMIDLVKIDPGVVREVEMVLKMIGFDADDTLWHSEVYYREAQEAMAELLTRYDVAHETVLDALHRIEIVNLKPFGYGIKGFTISMVETAIQVTGGRVSAADIQAVIDLGRMMTSHDIRLLDNSAETVQRLAQTYPLLLITKGDLMDQERKIEASGLAPYFRAVEVVSAKTPAVYAEVLRRQQISPEHFLMIGNAMRSDILPVLEIGGWAAHVPYLHSWAHEAAEAPEHAHFFAIEHLGQLPDLIDRIEGKN